MCNLIPLEYQDLIRYLCVPQWCQKNPHFTGRENLIKSIRHKLCDSISWQYTHRLAIYGMGGVGKTQIAIEYVAKFETEYVGIYWIPASSEANSYSRQESTLSTASNPVAPEVKAAVALGFPRLFQNS
jgi:hypothetical protein